MSTRSLVIGVRVSGFLHALSLQWNARCAALRDAYSAPDGSMMPFCSRSRDARLGADGLAARDFDFSDGESVNADIQRV